MGRWVIRCLLDRGHNVVNLDRLPGDDSRAQFVKGDVRQRAIIEPLLRDCDAVCHLAEIPSAGAPFTNDEIYWNNTRSASVLMQTAADLRLRHVVYASSCQVYGSWGGNGVAPLRLPIDESCLISPRNVYAVSKVANELFSQNLSERQNLGISIFRCPWVVATEDDERRLARLWIDEGPVGGELATFIHGRDLALAFAAALETPRAGCEVYNLSAAEVASIAPLRQRLERHHPDFPPLPLDWPDRKSPIVIEKAEKFLGWRPQWSVWRYLLFA